MTAQSTVSMSDLYNSFINNIYFEEKLLDSIKLDDILSIEQGEGIYIPTQSNTDLWINRKVSVMTVLGVPAVMESNDEFELRDSFGYMIWSGAAEDILAFAQEF